MRILVIIPVLAGIWEELTEREIANAVKPETQVDIVGLEKGPRSIESEYDEALAAEGILEKVKGAQKRYDAVVINCFADPSIHAAREVTKIPVLGPGIASMAIASLLGERFSVILPKIVARGGIGMVERMAGNYGFKSKLASVRSIGIEVLDFVKMREKLKSALLEEARKAVENDRADVLILGCTGMVGMAKEIQEALGVPVVDPAIAALKIAEALVNMNLSHSKIAYPEPPSGIRRSSSL